MVAHPAAQDAFDRVELVLDPRLAHGEAVHVGRLTLQREGRLERCVPGRLDRAKRRVALAQEQFGTRPAAGLPAGQQFRRSDRFVPSPLAFDAALDRAFAPSALRRALADSSASLVHSVTVSPLAGLAAQMVTLRATSGAIATFSDRDDTAVLAWESHDTSGARVSTASAVTAAKSCGSGPSSPLASPRSRIREARSAKASDSPFTAAVRWDPPPGVRTVLQNAATVAGSAGPAVNDHRNGVGAAAGGVLPATLHDGPHTGRGTVGGGAHEVEERVGAPRAAERLDQLGPDVLAGPAFVDDHQVHPR